MQRGESHLPSKLGEIFLEHRFFLIASDRELRRNRHDIYELNMNNKQ
jgi:hypothetical protein